MQIRRFHAATIAAVAITGLVTSGAQAAIKPKPKPVKPVCNLVRDTPGDADGSGVATAAPGLDIVSADLASNKKNLTAVIRLSGPPAASVNPNTVGGTAYYLQFGAPGATNPVYLVANIDFKGGVTYAYGDVEPTGGEKVSTDKGAITGNITGSVITMTVPLATFASLASIRAGMKLTDLNAVIYYLVGAAGTGALETADTESGTKPYVAGTPSCVKVPTT